MSRPIQKYRDLAEKLYTTTANETLHWKFEPFSNDLYTSLSQYKVFLVTGDDAEGSPYIRVDIKNTANEEVDWFTDNTISGSSPTINGPASYWTLMNDLYNMAYRKAKGADKALDDILSELDSDDPPF